jgi:hypothetical protein
MRDVGIGLADLETFETSDYMPGWIQRSYGYHGDDGRKFGKEYLHFTNYNIIFYLF